MVRGLTYATDPVKELINGKSVGSIQPYRWPTNEMREAAAAHGYTQVLNIGGNVLETGNHELQVEAIGIPEATGAGTFDDFDLKDVVRFFHQSA